jgi:ABC-type transport system involved in Fe-S cluster assembly fused permease/ATPase subunit
MSGPPYAPSFHQDSGVSTRINLLILCAVFTFVPTAVELVLVCGLLAKQVSTAFAGVVLLTFVAYVAWTVALTKASTASRKEVSSLHSRPQRGGQQCVLLEHPLRGVLRRWKI